MPALIERPEMSRAMWEALKTHILRERKRKKQEQEADAEEERQRRERENKQKQNIMTLDETKEQLLQLEKKLKELGAEKHELFNQLKKVLHEDETRRRAMIKETNELIGVASNYQPKHITMGGSHPHLFMNGGGQSRNSPMYKVGLPSQSPIMHQGSMKRPRSPSPPPVSYHPSYKNPAIGPFPSKHGPFSSTQPSTYYAQSTPLPSHAALHGPPSHLQGLSSAANIPGSTVLTQSQPHLGPYSSFRSQFSQGAAPDAKHLHPGYHLQGLPQSAYAGLLQQQLEQANQKTGFPEDRMYLCQSGSITSGFPGHVVHSSPSPFQPKSSTNPPVAHGSASSQRLTGNPPPTSRFY